MNWRVIRAIVRKDIIDVLKNSSMLLGLLLPIGTLLLFNPVFSGDIAEGPTIVILNPGNSAFVQMLDEIPQVEVIEVDSLEALQSRVQDDAIGGLVLSPQFDAKIAAGEQPGLVIYTNQQRDGAGAANFRRLIEGQLHIFAGHELPADIQTFDVSAEALDISFHLPDYLLILVLVMALALTGTSNVAALLVEEKEKHTLQAILVTPASPAEIALGKALVGLFYGLLLSTILIVLGQGWRGNWGLTGLIILLGALFMITVGLLLGSLIRTSGQLAIWASLVTLLLMVPSWLWLPVFTLPAPMRFVFRLLPTYYLADALRSGCCQHTTWPTRCASP
jgi:ABC-2 type transport system permease protein